MSLLVLLLPIVPERICLPLTVTPLTIAFFALENVIVATRGAGIRGNEYVLSCRARQLVSDVLSHQRRGAG